MKLTFLELSLMLFYITRILLYEEVLTHYGPFASKTKFVINKTNNYTRPVALFDWVRRAIPFFNPYAVEENLWYVDVKKMERWTCPLCLSFWTAALPTLYLILNSDYNWMSIIFLHFALAAASAIINYGVDYVMQLRS